MELQKIHHEKVKEKSGNFCFHEMLGTLTWNLPLSRSYQQELRQFHNLVGRPPALHHVPPFFARSLPWCFNLPGVHQLARRLSPMFPLQEQVQ